MKIGVDAGALGITDDRLKVGVYRVIVNILRELSRIDTRNEYILYSFDPIDRGVMSTFGPNMDNHVLWPVKGWFSFRLPLELKIHPVDIFLGMSQALPRSARHTIGFVHDVGFLFNPQAYTGSYKKLVRQTRHLVDSADRIITVSQSVKNDIVNSYKRRKDTITVVYNGIDATFTVQDGKFSNIRPYILFVGSLNKAKDLPLALRSYAMALKKSKTIFDFLLIGGDYWPDRAIDTTIRQLGLTERVKKIGVVTDSELPLYYRGALALFTTPYHEGFCLPAAEAMASGIPVVSVNRGAMKEIVGDGGVIVDSVHEEEIAEALLQVVDDGKLRRTLSSRAVIQARRFSWSSCARSIHSAIQEYEH